MWTSSRYMPSCIFPKEEIFLLRSCSWETTFTHAICNYMMTWLNLLNIYIPLFFFWSSSLSSVTSFPCLKLLQPFWHVALLCHHTIILRNNGSTPCETISKTLASSKRGEPSNEDSNKGSWLSSSGKCSFLMMMMHDELCARWLYSTHKYYLRFQWGYQELLPFSNDYYNHVDFYFNYPFNDVMSSCFNRMIPSPTVMHLIILPVLSIMTVILHKLKRTKWRKLSHS